MNDCRANLMQSGLPPTFWLTALLHGIYTRNRIPFSQGGQRGGDIPALLFLNLKSMGTHALHPYTHHTHWTPSVQSQPRPPLVP